MFSLVIPNKAQPHPKNRLYLYVAARTCLSCLLIWYHTSCRMARLSKSVRNVSREKLIFFSCVTGMTVYIGTTNPSSSYPFALISPAQQFPFDHHKTDYLSARLFCWRSAVQWTAMKADAYNSCMSQYQPPRKSKRRATYKGLLKSAACWGCLLDACEISRSARKWPENTATSLPDVPSLGIIPTVQCVASLSSSPSRPLRYGA